MKDSEVFKKIARRIEGYRDAMIDMERELTAIPALGPENGGQGEVAKAEYVKKALMNMGLGPVQEIKAPDDRVPDGYRPNLIVKYKGKSSAKTIWIMTHLDIVPPGDINLWHSDPYQVKVENGKLYGRGVEDNQQDMVASIFAVRALLDEGLFPQYDLGLTIVSDEETGSKKGLQFILQNHPELFRKEDLIIIPDGGNSEGTMIEVAEKSLLWLKFQVLGKQCHGSMPEKGINAHKAAAHLIVKLNSLYEIFNVSDPVFEPPISTFEPTKKEANVPNINTIPGEDIFYFDNRVMPQYKLEEVEARIRQMADEVEKQFGVKVNISSPQRDQAAPPTPTDAPVVKALEQAILAVHGKKAKTMGIGGGTVAAHFRRAGFNAAVWSTVDELAHQPNEYCWIDNLIKDAKVFAHVFLQ